MAKRFTNVVDRGRIAANKYSLVNNGDGTAIIKDIASNINVQGTPLNKDLFNPMQEGLIFTVDTIHSIQNNTDVYELEIDGLQGQTNLNGLPIFKGLTFNVKITNSNTTNVVKVKISGNKYDLTKEENNTLINLKRGEIGANKYYKIIYDGVRFVLFTGLGLEYKKWLETIGLDFGGYVSQVSNKEVGKAYINDVYDNKLYVCTVAHNSLVFDITKYRDITNAKTSEKVENLFRIETLAMTNTLGYIASQNVTEWYVNLPSHIKINKIISVTNLNLGSWLEYNNLDFGSNCIRVGCQGDIASTPANTIKVIVTYIP